MSRMSATMSPSTSAKGLHQSLRAIHRFLRDYTFLVLERCSVHGARHLARGNRHPVEVLFWLGAMLAVLFGMGLTVWMFVARHIETPIVVNWDRHYTQWNTTFPSITICAHEKLNDTAFERFIHSFISVDNVRPLSNRTRTFVRTLVNLRLDHAFDVPVHANGIGHDSFMRIMFKLTTRPEYRAVVAGGAPRHGAPHRFRAMLTDLGICDTFNSRIAPYLSPEFYVSGRRLQATTADGDGDRLHETNWLDTGRGRVTVSGVQPSDIYVHGPNDMPNSKNAIRIDYKRVLDGHTFRFKALSMLTGKNVRHLSIAQRKCRFHDESNLPHFPRTYSHALCQLECRIQSIRAWCQCVPMYFKALSGERTCNVLGLNCVHWFKDQIEMHVAKCHCDKSCEDVRYFLAGSSSAPLPVSSRQLRHNADNLSDARRTKAALPTLRIELDAPKRRLKMEILYSRADVMVSVGATLGLFVGLSALSVAEIIYWHVLQLSMLVRRLRYCFSG